MRRHLILRTIFFIGWLSVSACAQEIDRFGIPDTGDVHHRTGYVLGYDGRLRGARWTLEVLTATSIAGTEKRAGLSFHEDPEVLPEARSRLRDYAGSGYDIGHMAPAADHDRSLDELRDTFRLSNAHPQLPTFNRVRWRELETDIRQLLDDESIAAVWVLTGPLWIGAEDQQLRVRYVGASAIPVATHFYKSVVIQKRDGTIEPRTWIVAHVAEPGDLSRYRASIDTLEHWAGFDAWPQLPAALEADK